MSPQPQLSGPVAVPDDREELKRELNTARRQIEDLELELQKAKNQSRRSLSAIANLQRVLKPISDALRYMNGEIDSVDLSEVSTAATLAPGVSGALAGDRFAAIKAQLGGKQAEIINAIQTFGPSTRTQLRASTGGAMTTIDTAIYALRDKGVIVKNGDQWVLKGL